MYESFFYSLVFALHEIYSRVLSREGGGQGGF